MNPLAMSTAPLAAPSTSYIASLATLAADGAVDSGWSPHLREKRSLALAPIARTVSHGVTGDEDCGCDFFAVMCTNPIYLRFRVGGSTQTVVGVWWILYGKRWGNFPMILLMKHTRFLGCTQ
jgi:hypothetical protein